MANWHDILNEISGAQQEHIQAAKTVLDTVRRQHLKALADYTGRNTIAYYSGWLSKPNVEGVDITDEDKNSFMSCIHQMDVSKGLDLILHTPGGGIAATESIVYYLQQMFGKDIRAVVPQIAMSAGTMLALSCKAVVMGKQSSLGPIDPQLHGIPADVVIAEFKRAFDEISSDPRMAQVWGPILNRYSPSFLQQCEYAQKWSKEFVQKALQANMFDGLDQSQELAENLVSSFSDTSKNHAHDKHIHLDRLKELRVTLEVLEEDQTLQDRVLTVHHCYMHTLAGTSALKIVENDAGRAVVKHMVQPSPPNTVSIGFGSPSG